MTKESSGTDGQRGRRLCSQACAIWRNLSKKRKADWHFFLNISKLLRSHGDLSIAQVGVS